MTTLGKFNKQPVEVEVYSMQFAQDMASTDEITSTWQIIARKGVLWDNQPLTADYTATSADSGRIIVTDHNVTLPAETDGFTLSVANTNQSASITVGSFTVPARGAITVCGVSGAWRSEASTTSVLIDAPNDQRVRTFVTGGFTGQTYEVQVVVSTTEGRTLTNEFTVKVKEQ